MRLLKELRTLIGNYQVKSGVYHYHRSEYKQAVEFLNRALDDDENLSEADRSNARYYLTLTRMDHATRLQQRGELADAVEELNRAAEVSPHYPDVHYRLGGLLQELDLPEPAIAKYRDAIRRSPGYLDAHVALGFCLLESRRTEEAGEAFQEALRIKVQQIQRPFDEGLVRLEDGDERGAVECLHEAFRSLPRLADEILNKALDRLRTEDFEGALCELDRALALSPKYPDLHNFRGIALCGLERFEDAVRSFALSADLSPDYLVPRLNLAFARLRAGQHGEAEAELEAILERDPHEPVAAAKLEELRTGNSPERRVSGSKGSAR